MDRSRPPRICILTVDPSGDAIGAALAESLRRCGTVEVIGAGGPAMRRAGVEVLCESTDWTAVGVVGWAYVLHRAIPGSHRLRWAINARKPDILVPIDSGGFNVPVARTLKRWLGIKVLYYIPPRCWSRRWQVNRLARVADYVAAPFPWNLNGDDGTGRVRFVGHPAADLAVRLPGQADLRRELGLAPDRPVLAALPGSRRLEVGIHLPILIDTARLLRADLPELQVVVSRAPTIRKGRLQAQFEALAAEGFRVVEGAATALRAADAALVCFGTATLESCVLGCPLVALYRGTRLMALEYRFHRPPTDYLALPNIIAEEPVVLELIGRNASPERLATEARRLLCDPAARSSLTTRLDAVTRMLGGPGAADRTAQAVFDVLNDRWHAAHAEGTQMAASAPRGSTRPPQ